MNLNLQKYFDLPIIEVEETTLGLSNRVVLVTLENHKQYMVRIPYDHNRHVFNYNIESKVIHLINDTSISLPTVYFDSETGIKISHYYRDLLVLNEVNLEDNIEKIASKLRLHHQIPTVNSEFNLREKYNTFKSFVKDPLFDLSHYEKILDKFDNFTHRVLCHNDLVNGNIVFLNDDCYLIDFEYAADNHPYFDLLSFITENNINEPSLREKFYHAYFDMPITDEIRKDLSVFEDIHNLLWCQWAMMQFSLLHQDIYYEIAREKYERLLSTNLYSKRNLIGY